MTTPGPFTLKWGILSTGRISSTMAKDLLIPTSTRNVENEINHKITAVASRSVEKAKKFVDDFCGGDHQGIRCFGNYDEFYKASDIDCVYIGTPHSHHYANTISCLSNGKSVLLEKVATVNVKQWKKLVDLAREKNLFLMEACWTRFFPITYEIQKHIQDGKIGQIQHVHAEFCSNFQIEKINSKHRIVDPNLAGGSLLDQGPYPYIWICLSLIHTLLSKHPDFPKTSPLPVPEISSQIIKSNAFQTSRLGGHQIDLHSIGILKFPSTWPDIQSALASDLKDEVGAGEATTAVLETSLRQAKAGERAVLIGGTKGQIVVKFPPYRPEVYVLESWKPEEGYWKANGQDAVKTERKFDLPGNSWGFVYEADECARCIRDGKIESERMPWRETTLMMEIFDEMRRQNDFYYPSNLEALEGTPSS